uniref:Uncharacterized protein n=1 Tax=Candidatus Kentrum sp. FM TaxID=2126340 RepID=A0A450SRX0_9GAMM|nr:MAG: hypothetical protein BECKFM1743C_GA0114222_101854 [Candidatus Kentron sp. FM]VFJ57092.1 MAG: hypothetical protein BECKFM1743A_GA0114220_101823 [Candidatus Kentron sp. FM]VFK11467.1 MAG: hypothetical protein BECKFM1743B_GA0114221_101834 [Candidatus Kentron sp. FM]
MPPLLLTPFLDTLRDDIPIGVRDYQRMAIMLSASGPWTVARLRDTLLALLVKNRDQQNKFLGRFEAFFPADAEAVLTEEDIARVIANLEMRAQARRQPQGADSLDGARPRRPGGASPEDPARHKFLRKFWRKFLGIGAGVLLSVIAVATVRYVLYSRPPVPPPPPAEPPSPTLVLDPIRLDFGTFAFDPETPVDAPDRTRAGEIRVTNPGPGPVTIRGLALTGPDAGAFLVPAGPEEAIPAVSLGEGQQQALSVAYRPTLDGTHTANLDIQCDSPPCPRAILLGRGEYKLADVPATRLYPDMPYVDRIEYYPLPAPDRSWLLYAALAVLSLLAAMGYGVHLYRYRKIPEDRPAAFDPEGPRRFSLTEIGGRPAPILSDALLDHLADSMGYFQSERPGRKLDVAASVAATVENPGPPRLVFQRRRQVRALLILEDTFAEAHSWNPIARELAAGMDRRGVPVIHGRYRRVPEPFYLEDGTAMALEDLEDRRQGMLVLVFGDGGGDAAGRFAWERLARWPMVARIDV